MKRLILVSNRLPVSVERLDEGLNFKKSMGGLATGLASFYKDFDSRWIGWCGMKSEDMSDDETAYVKEELAARYSCLPASLTADDMKDYYLGFCNKTIWPLFHYFPQYTVYDRNSWNAYKRVNEKFFRAVMETALPRDNIWIHDYHLMLLPAMLRKELPEASIGFFLHIPFPSYEIFRLLPWREELLEGLMGSDLIGFHTFDYVKHFLNSAHYILGHEHSFGKIAMGNRTVQVSDFPIGIDYGKFARSSESAETRKEMKKIKDEVRGRKIILSIDRLDYSKGILQRLKAFDLFLEKHPEYREKITLILVAVPSRTRVEAYKKLKTKLDKAVGTLNGKHGTMGWVPVWYKFGSLPFETMTAAYYTADVALVTPLRDGMNLIAKEYIAAKAESGRGVLILSEMAGAAKELGESTIVNPNNEEEIALALKEALEMPESDQSEKIGRMQNRLKNYSVTHWAEDFIETLAGVKDLQLDAQKKMLDDKTKKMIINDYRESGSRLLFIDYDGTLVPFGGRPEKAKPDGDLLDILEELGSDEKNELVMISGRDKNTLQEWFGHLNTGFIAEHGVWIKPKGNDWDMPVHLTDAWKEEVYPLMRVYSERTPGSFIEEKDYSLVWHYRKSDPRQGAERARELAQDLDHLTSQFKLGILEGSKLVEVKARNVDKGRAASQWIKDGKYDFIIAVGDDVTDEDTFEALPPDSYTVKVGNGSTIAGYRIPSFKEVRAFLSELASAG